MSKVVITVEIVREPDFPPDFISKQADNLVDEISQWDGVVSVDWSWTTDE